MCASLPGNHTLRMFLFITSEGNIYQDWGNEKNETQLSIGPPTFNERHITTGIQSLHVYAFP